MQNISITINGVTKQYSLVTGLQDHKNHKIDALFNGQWYREVEPVKQGYEIQSFRNSSNSIYSLKKDGNYHVEHIAALHLNCCLANVKNGFMFIESVKRLSDGEVFTVRDIDKNCGEIKEFKIDISGLYVLHLNGDTLYLDLMEKVKQPTILLTTKDGKTITDGEQMLYGANERWERWIGIANAAQYKKIKYFSTEAARDEYILMNKPISVTLAEIIKIYRDCLDDESTIEDDHRDFFKAKQKQ